MRLNPSPRAGARTGPGVRLAFVRLMRAWLGSIFCFLLATILALSLLPADRAEAVDGQAIILAPLAPHPMQRVGGDQTVRVKEESSLVTIDLGRGLVVQVGKDGRIGCVVDGTTYASAQAGAPPRVLGPVETATKPEYVAGKTPLKVLQNGYQTKTVADTFVLDKVTTSGGKASLAFRAKNIPGMILRYDITPSVFRLENKEWCGFGISYRVESTGTSLSRLFAQTAWSLGKSGAANNTWGHTPYGKSRGFRDVRLASGIFKSEKLDFHNMLFESQAFTLVAGNSISHLSFMEPGMVADAGLESTRDGYSLTYQYDLGLTATASTPVTHHLFLKRQVTAEDYPGISWSLNAHLRVLAGLPPLKAEPIASASRDNQITLMVDWRKYADKVLPTTKRLGFKRLFIGMIPSKKPQLIFEFPNKEKIFSDLRYFNDRAHHDGIATILWTPTCTGQVDSEVVRNHPEWVIIQADGSAAHYDQIPNLLVLYPDTDYIRWLQAQIVELRQKTGVDGLWLDSVALTARLTTFTDRNAGSPVGRIQNYIAKLDAEGFVTYAEGLTPFALPSFWVRKGKYLPYKGVEYGLTGASPLTNRPDSDFVDYFKAASFKSFPLFDIHPMIESKPVYANQDELAARIPLTNKAVYRAIEALGSEAVPRAFEGGAYWISDKGLAVFTHVPISRLTLKVDGRSKTETFPCRPGLASPKITSSSNKAGDLIVENLPAETVFLVTLPTKR